MVQAGNVLRTVGIAYTATSLALVAYNVRWRYLWRTIVGQKPRVLPVSQKNPNSSGCTDKKVVVVLLHGMWHDASFYARLQDLLADRGYTSLAVDLLPGERLLPGGSQKELVADLECTLHAAFPDSNVDFILVGHSQGGLIAQSCLRNSEKLRQYTAGVVLLGTYPLGCTPSLSLLRQPRNMYNDIGYAYICAFGRLWNKRYTKHIFLLPTTDETTDPTLQGYLQRLLHAPSDGLVTMSHFPQTPYVAANTPALILGAEGDIIYPPHLLAEEFDRRFPSRKQTTHIVVKGQAHCFVDPGWESAMAEPMMEWMDKVCLGRCI